MTFSLLIFSLTNFQAVKAVGTCDWWIGGCYGVPLENPGITWGGTAASCMASICANKTTCSSVAPGAPYGCYYNF